MNQGTQDAQGETWVTWYRVEAGPDGLLIIGQDDESFAFDEEDGVEGLCHRLNQLWNAHNESASRSQALEADVKAAAETYVVALDVSEQQWRKELAAAEAALSEANARLAESKKLNDNLNLRIKALQEFALAHGATEVHALSRITPNQDLQEVEG